MADVIVEMPRIPGLSDDENATLKALLEQLSKKRARNALRSAYYDMKHFTPLVGSVIPAQYASLAMVVGWSGKAVDTLARRCNMDDFIWPDGDIDSLGFAEFAEANNLWSEFGQTRVSSLIHSVAFAINTVGGDDEPESLLHFKNALNATGVWNARTRRLDSLLSINEWGKDEKPSAFALYLDGVTITGVKDRTWSIGRQKHSWGVPAEPLPYKPRLERPFGSSRISRAAMSLQDQATRALVRLEAHSDIYAIPDLWMLGADMSIFKNADGTQRRAWDVMMGRMKGVPDDPEAIDDRLARVDVKQFAASDPEPHLKAIKQAAQLFSGETSIPLTSLGVSDMSNPTSADSYIASREDLIAEAEGATDDWTPYLRRAIVRGLAIQNGVKSVDDIPAEWLSMGPKWRSPIYLSRAQQADAGMKQVTAIPWLADTDVGLELLGLSPQQIERATAERRRMGGSELLASLTDAAPEVSETSLSQKSTDDAMAMKAKFDALGVAIRAGVKPEVAAAQLGLAGLQFTGLQPVSLRDPNANQG